MITDSVNQNHSHDRTTIGYFDCDLYQKETDTNSIKTYMIHDYQASLLRSVRTQIKEEFGSKYAY